MELMLLMLRVRVVRMRVIVIVVIPGWRRRILGWRLMVVLLVLMMLVVAEKISRLRDIVTLAILLAWGELGIHNNGLLVLMMMMMRSCSGMLMQLISCSAWSLSAAGRPVHQKRRHGCTARPDCRH